MLPRQCQKRKMFTTAVGLGLQVVSGVQYMTLKRLFSICIFTMTILRKFPTSPQSPVCKADERVEVIVI